MNYAAKSAGAVVIDSNKDFKYVGNILDDVESNYALVPCANKHKYVTIGLSEDSQVDGDFTEECRSIFWYNDGRASAW